MAFQRHLRLEQHRYQNCEAAHQLVGQELDCVKSELDTILTLNEMLRQEVEHGQHIIESMAIKISQYENTATNMAESSMGGWGHHDETLSAEKPSPFLQSELAIPESSATMIRESSQLLVAKKRPCKRSSGSEKKTRVKRPGKSEASLPEIVT